MFINNIIIKEVIKRCVNIYGLEGTEQHIKNICLPKFPLLYEIHMLEYKKLIKGEC